MERIRDNGVFVFPENTKGYVIGTKDEIEEERKRIEITSEDLELVDTNIKPGNGLVLWYEDNSDRDDDLKVFMVKPREKIFEIIYKAPTQEGQ